MCNIPMEILQQTEEQTNPEVAPETPVEGAPEVAPETTSAPEAPAAPSEEGVETPSEEADGM